MPDHGDSAHTLSSRFVVASESPGLALWRATNRWQAVMRKALARHDLTHVQYVLLASLVWLHAADPARRITQADLAAHAATDVMMTSQVLRALEAKQLVERAPHPTDGRARVMTPTASGTAAAQRATRDVEAADAAFFAPVADAPALTAALGRLVEA